ncbi:uncharacterized protein LOC117584081 [Drosophila guanche]|uniref:Blast:Transcription factor Adf-1 n=1 Tax=Drosophila guanche TaxID=7266 RepID=A0A3B0JHX7_DROGU|nr:uncharacterized protein LOC117584081 [Drosophila guanche]SPP81805.1 blast:Transcription factor Adf-1 [Drosophila guanche]
MDESELIKLIKSCPILYDKDSARSVKNAALKDAAWKSISQKIGASERACITRWKSIRDRFGKEFRRFQENPDVPTYWDMFPHLLFLKDHYKHGQVRHDSLEGIKFEPKVRRRRNRLYAEHEKNPNDEEDDCKGDMLNELIELVKMHPVLYDKDQIRISKNLSAKNEAWREISESLNVSEVLCFNRWKKLRERFAREYRNQQINSSTPSTWKYFNDLLFLDKHFRKGVPLVIENIKKRGRPPKASNQTGSTVKQPTNVSIVNGEQIWGADYPYSTDNDEQDNDLELCYDEPEDIEFAPEPEQTTAYDFILTQTAAPSQQLAQDVSVELLPYNESFDLRSESSAVRNVAGISEDETTAATSDKLLDHVIANMETVLQQSRELQTQLQHEQQQPPAIRSLLDKAQMLLDGLSPDQRSSAMRKIGHFVHHCQIKALEGEVIEDLTPYQVFNC